MRESIVKCADCETEWTHQEEGGSGITTQEIVDAIGDKLQKGYSDQLQTLVARKLMSKKQLGDMVAAFRDGYGSAMSTLIDMGIIVLISEVK